MGSYINPRTESKEDFLIREGEPIDGPTDAMITPSSLPVCLVNNGPFTAAAIAFNQRELDTFAQEDGRMKFWFQVPIDKLLEVSDLRFYL